MTRLLSSVVAVILGFGTAVQADELVLRFGIDDAENNTNSRAPVLNAEYYFNPFWQRERFSAGLGLAASIDGDSDLYVAAGVRGVFDLSDKWFAEGSLMAGYFDQGSGGTPLGYDLEFRTLLGVNYRLNDSSYIGLAIAHISNADLGQTNPGTNQLTLSYGRAF